MKKQILFGVLVFLVMNTNAQNIIEDLYLPKHHLSDFGLSGKVKSSVVTSYFQNEDGEFVAFGFPAENIAYHFNDKGLLMAEYYIKGNSDTTEFNIYSYNKKDLLTKVSRYKNYSRGKLNTVNKTEWNKEIEEFIYNDNGQLLSNSREGNSPNTWTHEYDKDGILVKSNNIQGKSATLSQTYFRKYTFDRKSNLLLAIDEVNELESESWRNPTGKTQFKYEGKVLLEKEFKGSKSVMPKITRYDKNGRMTEDYTGDSTENAVYTKDTYVFFDVAKFSYDELGNLSSVYTHTNGDGVFKNRTTVEYKFDVNKNWTQSISTRKDVISHSRDDDRVRRDKAERIITYYK